LDDIVIDRIQMATAEKTDGTLLYTLTQLSEATIETTAESKEARSAEGSLIKRFYTGKAGTFTATNAMLNLNVLAAATGTEKEVASELAKIQMPKIIIVKKDVETVDLLADGEDMVSGSIRVNALGNNGAMGKAYTLGTDAASATEFIYNSSTGVLTMPTDTTVDRFVVKYERKTQNAVKITNSADKFPSTVKLTLKALAIDPCEPDTVRSCYIIIPSFQVSPEVSITINTEGTLDYTGDMQISYCSPDKELYTIVMCGDDEE
jgi:hypothetical protein